MWDGRVPGPPEDGEPIPFAPHEVTSAGATELELVADIWSRGGAGPDARAARPLALSDVSDVSDDFVSELAVIRHCSEADASRLAVESLLLTTKLSPTWSALFAGRLTVRKARILLDLLGDASDAVAAEVQARVLPGAEDCPPSRLGDRARYHLYRVDGAAKERRRREAERKADVHVERTADDLGRLVIEGPLPAVHAARGAVDQYARWMRAEGDDRPMGMLRSSVALGLILRPWETGRPAVTAHLNIHAALPALRPDATPGATPAELDGQLISAAQCRELLATLDVLGLSSPPAGGSIAVAVDDPASGETIAVATAQSSAGRPGDVVSAAGRPPAGPVGPTPRTGRGCSPRRRTGVTAPPPGNGGSSPSATGTAGCRAAVAAPGAATSTTWSRSPTAARRRVRTSAACAGAITGSRPSPGDGHSPCSTTDSSSSAPRRVSRGARVRPAGTPIPSRSRRGSRSSRRPMHCRSEGRASS